jgi:hypothetical protein
MSESSNVASASKGEERSSSTMLELKKSMCSMLETFDFQRVWGGDTISANTQACLAELQAICRIAETILLVTKQDSSFVDLETSLQRCAAVMRVLARRECTMSQVYAELEPYFARMMEIVDKKQAELIEILGREEKNDGSDLRFRQYVIWQALKQMRWHYDHQKVLCLQTQCFLDNLNKELEFLEAVRFKIFDVIYDRSFVSQAHTEACEADDTCPICTEAYETDRTSARLRTTMACCAHKNSLCAGCLNMHAFRAAERGTDALLVCPFCRHETPLYGPWPPVAASPPTPTSSAIPNAE